MKDKLGEKIMINFIDGSKKDKEDKKIEKEKAWKSVS